MPVTDTDRPGSRSGLMAELAAADGGRLCCRRSEAAGLVQFSGGARVAGTALRVVAGTPAAGTRLAARLGELAAAPRVSVRLAGHLVAVDGGGPAIVAALGLMDRRGAPLRGLPTAVLHGRDCDAAAVWRAAMLSAGRLRRRGGWAELLVTCPGPELALALAGAARRLGARPRTTPITLGQRRHLTQRPAIQPEPKDLFHLDHGHLPVGHATTATASRP